MKIFTNVNFLFFTLVCLGLFTSCGDDDTIGGNGGDVSGGAIDQEAATLFRDYFDSGSNVYADPSFTSQFMPMSDLGSTCATGADTDDADYKGAIMPNGTPWYSGWSSYENILNGSGTKSFSTGNIVNISDADMTSAGSEINWTNDNTYVLDGLVFVNAGQTLNIQAGTVIQGKPGEGANASALIIARGAKIIAEGTAAQPIVFTFEGDTGLTAPTERGRWGGLIVLGASSLNSNPGESAIEGIDTNEARGLYGGNDEGDNSGILKYISVRHGGTNIGADNEINGITFGGVGSGTVVDFIEVIGNKDDGIEWFGGTVNTKHILSIYCGDDGLDYDEGYRGVNQYIIVHQDPADSAADRGGEHDGGTNPEEATPYATPIFTNVTSIGNSGSRAITFRDNAGGEYYNSIFINYGKGIDVENIIGQDQDSFKQFQDFNLKLECNVFWNIGAGTTGAELFTISN